MGIEYTKLVGMMDDFARIALGGPMGSVGVYLLLRQGEVVYVGQSVNVLARVNAHWNNLQRVRKGKKPYHTGGGYEWTVVPFDEVRIKRCLPCDLDREELALIQRYLPKKNTLLNRPEKPMEKNIRDLPCIQALFKKAEERAKERDEKVFHRRSLPVEVARVEKAFQTHRDRRRPISLPKVKCLEEEHAP